MIIPNLLYTSKKIQSYTRIKFNSVHKKRVVIESIIEFLKQGHAFQKGVIGETVNMLLLRGLTQQQKNDEQTEIIFLYYGFLLTLNRNPLKISTTFQERISKTKTLYFVFQVKSVTFVL